MKFKNRSGLRPVEFKVLVRPDGVEKKSEGGVYIPELASEQQQMAQVKGTLVARGGKAFYDWPESERDALSPGARIYYNKYAGITVYGADGAEYKLVSDKDVSSLIENEGAAPIHAIRGRSREGLDAA